VRQEAGARSTGRGREVRSEVEEEDMCTEDKLDKKGPEEGAELTSEVIGGSFLFKILKCLS
jgi:hypothetical protein